MSIWFERNVAPDFVDQSFLQEFEEMVKAEGFNEIDAKLLENLEPVLTQTIDIEMESPQKVQPDNHRIQLSLPESFCTTDEHKSTSVHSPKPSISMLVGVKRKDTVILRNGHETEGKLQKESFLMVPKTIKSNSISKPAPMSQQKNITSIKAEKTAALAALFSKSVCTTVPNAEVKYKVGIPKIHRVKKDGKVKSTKSSIRKVKQEAKGKSTKSSNVRGQSRSVLLAAKNISQTQNLGNINSIVSTESNGMLFKALVSPSNSVSTSTEIVSKNSTCAWPLNTSVRERNKTLGITCHNVELPSVNIYNNFALNNSIVANKHSLLETSNIVTAKIVDTPKVMHVNKKLNTLLRYRLPETENNTKNKAAISISKNVSPIASSNSSNISSSKIQQVHSNVSCNSSNVNARNIQNVSFTVSSNSSNTSDIQNVKQPAPITNSIISKAKTVTNNCVNNVLTNQQTPHNTNKSTKAKINQTVVLNNKEPPPKKPRIFVNNSKAAKTKRIEDYIKKELENGFTGNTDNPIQIKNNSTKSVPVHLEVNSYLCQMCGNIFLKKEILVKHMELIHGIKTVKTTNDVVERPVNDEQNPSVIQSNTQSCINSVKQRSKTIVKRDMFDINSTNNTSSVIIENNVNFVDVNNGIILPMAVESNVINPKVEINTVDTIKNENVSSEEVISKNKAGLQGKFKPSILSKAVIIKKEFRAKKINVKNEVGVLDDGKNNETTCVSEFTKNHSIPFTANGRIMNKCKYCKESYTDIFILARHLSSNHKIHEDKASCNYGITMIDLFNM